MPALFEEWARRLRIDRFVTWQGATRLDSLETFLMVELLPIADAVPGNVREAIVDDCRTAMREFVDTAGAVAAPLEVHLITATAHHGSP